MKKKFISDKVVEQNNRTYPPLINSKIKVCQLRMFYETMKEYQEVTMNLHAYEIWDMVRYKNLQKLDV